MIRIIRKSPSACWPTGRATIAVTPPPAGCRPPGHRRASPGWAPASPPAGDLPGDGSGRSELILLPEGWRVGVRRFHDLTPAGGLRMAGRRIGLEVRAEAERPEAGGRARAADHRQRTSIVFPVKGRRSGETAGGG